MTFQAGIRHSAKRIVAKAALCAAMLAASPSLAATGNVTFYGNINSNSSCQIVVNNHGTLGVSANVRQLSSKIAGGGPGRATITQRGVYDINATTLPNFSVGPIGADTGVTRQVRFSGAAVNPLTGFTIPIAERPAFPGIRVTSLGFFSRVNLDLHFIADRPTAFPSGPYEAVVILRCE